MWIIITTTSIMFFIAGCLMYRDLKNGVNLEVGDYFLYILIALVIGGLLGGAILFVVNKIFVE